MFRTSPIAEKQAVLLVANASIPTEIGVAPDLQENQIAVWDHLWCSDFIKALCAELDLGESNIQRYTPFALSGKKYEEMCWEDRESLMRPAIDFLLTEDASGPGDARDPSASDADASDADTRDLTTADPATARLRFYTQLLIMLVHMRRLDGRGRVIMRHVLRALHLEVEHGVWVEYELGCYLAEQAGGTLKGDDRKRDKFRYAKIGVAALGAGALLAFTGGLVRCTREQRL